LLAHKGRIRIYTDETDITAQNVRSVVNDALTKHLTNANDIQTLYDIEKGKMELSRKKDIRPEINVEVIDPIPSQIIDFKLGYEHGEPINYIQRANVDAKNANGNADEVVKDDLRIITLNEMMREVKKASKDNKLARDIKICGVGYRYIVPVRKIRNIAPFDMVILSPLRTFIIYSNDAFSRPMAAVTYTENIYNKTKRFGVWTENSYFEFVDTLGAGGINESRNLLGMIPIVEYVNNDDLMGSFEKELPLIDALNVVGSDRVNDVCQTVQSILWLHNTKLDDEQKADLVDGGVIQTQANADGKDAKIQYVNAPLNQTEIQTLANNIKERILESAGVPKLSDANNSTGEAMRVTNGWHTAETQAKTSELVWREAEDMSLEICLEIIRQSNTTINGIDSLNLSDIEYEMHRSENYDIVSRVNAFATLVNLGCDISKSALYCKITDDALQFAKDSEEGINKKRFGGVPNDIVEVEDKTTESIQPDTVKY